MYMSEDESTSLFAIKLTTLLSVIFLTHTHLFLHNIYSLQVISLSHW